jgi:hypothetical protein
LGQKQFGQSVPNPHQIGAGIFAGSRQIANRLDFCFDLAMIGSQPCPLDQTRFLIDGMRNHRKRVHI